MPSAVAVVFTNVRRETPAGLDSVCIAGSLFMVLWRRALADLPDPRYSPRKNVHEIRAQPGNDREPCRAAWFSSLLIVMAPSGCQTTGRTTHMAAMETFVADLAQWQGRSHERDVPNAIGPRPRPARPAGCKTR